MKLYAINAEIEALLNELEPDPETGEVTGDYESVVARLEQLDIEKKSVLGYLAKLVLNARSEAESIKTEEKRLRDRRQALERRDERLMRILDRECGGENTDCGVATVYYRKTARVNVTDSAKAVLWLQNNHEECVRYQEPEISKTEVKKLLTAGTEVPGVELVRDLSCSLR
jgi:hypothetical protein